MRRFVSTLMMSYIENIPEGGHAVLKSKEKDRKNKGKNQN